MTNPHILTEDDINHIEDEIYTVLLAAGKAKEGYKRLYLEWNVNVEGYKVFNLATKYEQKFEDFYKAVAAYNEL